MTDDEIVGFAKVKSKATVSKYVNKYKEFLREHSEEKALEEWGLLDEFKDLHELSVLLKKKLALDDASVGLRVIKKARSLKLHEDEIDGFIDGFSSYVDKKGVKADELFESAEDLMDLGGRWGLVLRKW